MSQGLLSELAVLEKRINTPILLANQKSNFNTAIICIKHDHTNRIKNQICLFPCCFVLYNTSALHKES